jgi:hypothetical protein
VANATYATSAGSATTAGTVTTASQGNITSVGTLTGLTVTGNISAGNIFGNIISGKLRSTKSIPSTVEGLSGDVEGDIAIDENFLYYCYQNFPESSTFVITSNDTQTRNDIESNIPLSSVPAYVVPGWTVNLNLSGNRTITNITEVNGSATFAFSGGPVTTGYGAQYTLSAPTPDPIWVSVPLTSFESPNYGNANVSTFLAAYGNNTVSTTGNITAGNIIATNVGNIASLNLNSNASTVLYGNGTFASLPASSSYGNADVTTLLGNLGSNVISSTGNISTTANISGGYILGNGSQLTSLPAPTVAQDITSVGAMSIMTYDGNLKYASYATIEPASGNIAGNNISATGNITANNLGNISTINLTGSSSNVLYGNGTFAPAAGGGSGTVTNVQGDGIVSGLSLTGNVTTTGNLTLGGTLDLSSLSGNISTTGNISGGNVDTINLVVNNISSDDSSFVTIQDGVNVNGEISATGNVAGTIFVGKPPLTAIKTETSNYTPTADDHGYYIQMNSTSPLTVTLVADVAESIPVGTTFVIGQINTGGVEFAAGAGATVHSPVSLVISGQWAKASVIKTAANTWQVEGNLAP